MAPGNNGPWAGLPRCGGKGLPVGLAGQAGLGTLVPLGCGGRGALAPAWPRAADDLGRGAGTGRSPARLALLQALPALETSSVSHALRPSAASCPPGRDWGARGGSSRGLGQSEPAEPPGGGQGPGPSPLLSAEVVPELWLGTGHHSRCPVKMKCLTDGCQMASASVHTCPRGLRPGSPRLAVLPVRHVFSAVLPFSIRMGLLELEVGTAPIWAQAAWAGEGAHEGTRRGLALPSAGPRLLPALQSPLSCFILSPDLVRHV